jgi:hypothetical protein
VLDEQDLWQLKRDIALGRYAPSLPGDSEARLQRLNSFCRLWGLPLIATSDPRYMDLARRVATAAEAAYVVGPWIPGVLEDWPIVLEQVQTLGVGPEITNLSEFAWEMRGWERPETGRFEFGPILICNPDLDAACVAEAGRIGVSAIGPRLAAPAVDGDLVEALLEGLTRLVPVALFSAPSAQPLHPPQGTSRVQVDSHERVARWRLLQRKSRGAR